MSRRPVTVDWDCIPAFNHEVFGLADECAAIERPGHAPVTFPVVGLLAVVVSGILFWFCRAVIAWGFRELWKSAKDWFQLRMYEERLKRMKRPPAQSLPDPD